MKLTEQLRFLNSKADRLHVDIMDGHYVKNLALSASFVAQIRPYTSLPIDVHLMVEAPASFIPALLDAGADAFSLHPETICREAFRVINMLRQAGKEVGMVLNPATPVESIQHYLHLLDKVTVMTVDPGYAGQPFIPESLVACGSMTSAGGKGANQATAALKAGANVHYIGKIGNDTFGHFARRHLKGVGFNAVTLLVAEEIPTGNALIYVAGNDAENMIAVDPGANMTVTDDEIAGCIPAIGCADVVLVQLENNLSAIEQVIDAGKQAGALVILNPAPWQPVEHAVLSKVDLLTPNATEAGLMTGRRVDSLTAAPEAADVLHAQGARNVIITLGASGALLSEHGVKSPIPCFPSHPRDTTGAGDAFNGALAARLACGEPLQAAARFAAAYAAVSVEKQGASSLPEYLEAQERLLRAAADYEMA
ncbi:PfkB family carbohydrate kinase [Klebsiella pneumoniae]|uniref:PfkB family carbohydrate kinase n=5 Tax=Enterobacterales TaxID=91347 RepID=UPI0039763042